jgi:phosphatidate cytidylyltransferase
MDEGKILLLLLSIYFTVGAIMTFKINKRKDKNASSQSWLKYLVYLGIIFTLFFIIYYLESYFKIACLWIMLIGFFELFRLEIKSPVHNKLFFPVVFVIFSVLTWQFYSFSLLEKPILLITFFTVSAFDAFSQMMGQLLGKSKIIPSISPNKTVGGFIGGLILATLTALLVGNLLKFDFEISILWGLCIALSSFIGDLAASIVKRKYQVKDFSQLIPGHGGYLDRFDSLIFAGAAVSLLNRFF